MPERSKRYAQNALLSVGSLAAVFIFAVIADRVIGRFDPVSALDEGLLFPPYSAVRYETIEFDIHAYINNLGFRGDDTTAEKGHNTRIVAIGDSFTFGWGASTKSVTRSRTFLCGARRKWWSPRRWPRPSRVMVAV